MSILIVVPSKFFRRNRAYDVIRWGHGGWPFVRCDTGACTWLHDPRTWRLADVPACS